MTPDTSVNKVSEGGHSSKGPEKKHVETPEDFKEIEEAGVGREAYAEAVEGGEESAETMGQVSEVLGEGKEKKPAGGAKTTGDSITDPAQIRAELLKNLPTQKVMRRHIEREIKKEIIYLHKKTMKAMRSPGSMSYFEMSNLMKKIRELRGILFLLLKASFEKLKTLWLRFVHGVM